MGNNRQGREDGQQLASTSSSNQSGSNDFVKKLFQMLQEDSYKDIVRWTSRGDSFVVINMTDFTKEILPRHFKHSNFASFVRQLNKYDFHKVKIPNEEKHNYEYGEDAWEFKHPDFKMNDIESLENIKRKSSRKNVQTSQNATGTNNGADVHYVQQLKFEVENLRQESNLLSQDMHVLRTKYKALAENIVSLNTFNENWYRSMSMLATCVAQAGIKVPPLEMPNPNLLSLLQNSVPTHPQPHSHSRSHSSSNSLNMSPLIKTSGGSNVQEGHIRNIGSVGSTGYDSNFISQQPPMPQSQMTTLPSQANSSQPMASMSDPAEAKAQSPSTLANTNSHLVPKIEAGKEDTKAGVNHRMQPSASPQNNEAIGPAPGNPSIMTTNTPNPKFNVLLVEDDNICILLCRRFLVKYGCQVTVATDGLNAISTAENRKYDLVLMDIVMPNLDGATATSVIRSFDTRTPIIAMTGNIEDNDLVTYLQNGMSDILAKPFTKDDLYSILSKHLLFEHDNNNNVNTANEGDIMDEIQGQTPRGSTMPQDISNADDGELLGDSITKKQRLN